MSINLLIMRLKVVAIAMLCDIYLGMRLFICVSKNWLGSLLDHEIHVFRGQNINGWGFLLKTK